MYINFSLPVIARFFICWGSIYGVNHMYTLWHLIQGSLVAYSKPLFDDTDTTRKRVLPETLCGEYAGPESFRAFYSLNIDSDF